MPTPIARPSFAAGEVSPALHGRVDLAKYQVALATCQNWIVHAFGGASTRAGTEWVGEIADSTARGRLVPFVFSQAQAYVLEFGDETLRFISDGGYVLETAGPITGITQASPGVVTDVAHGYATGDHVWLDGILGMTELNRRRVTVTVTGVNSYSIGIDTTAYGAWSSGGTASRLVTVATPYDTASLSLLKFVQSADTMTITHPAYAPRSLVRTGMAAFTLSEILFRPLVEPPTNVASSAVGTAFYYVVTAIDDDTGEESLASNEAGSSTQTSNITFTATPNCTYYSVYKKKNGIFGFVGRVKAGEAFTDATIVPDYTDTPPQQKNPFGGSAISSVTVVNGGAGYSAPPALALGVADASGSGAVLVPTVSAGVITGVAVTSGGRNYSDAAAVTFLDGSGGGAVLRLDMAVGGTTNHPDGAYDADGYPTQVTYYTIAGVTVLAGGASYAANAKAHTIVNGIVDYGGIVLTPTVAAGVVTSVAVTSAGSVTGWFDLPGHGFPTAYMADSAGTGAVLTLARSSEIDNPGVSTFHDGRQWYARTNTRPQTLFASQSANFRSMATSQPTRDSDAIVRTIASREVNEIRALLSLNILLVFTSGAVWKCWAGSQADVITPANCAVKPQSYEGISHIPPIATESSALYVTSSGKKVRDVAYEFASDSFQGRNLSILAGHLFESENLEEWAYARDPDGIVWAVRGDGVLLGFTYLKEHDVYAWHRHETEGEVESVATIQEGSESALYLIVRRTVGGATKRYVERMASRTWTNLAQAWCLDCARGEAVSGSTTWNTTAASTLAISGASYAVGATVTLSSFSENLAFPNEYVLRAGDDTVSVRISAPVSSPFHTAQAVFLEAAPAALQATATADWGLGVTRLGGLWHLDGERISVTVDGVPDSDSSLVTNGRIIVGRTGTMAVAGLPYACDLETLNIEVPPGSVQGRQKTVQRLLIRLKQSRGLELGPNDDQLRDMKQTGVDAAGLITGDVDQLLDPSWNSNGRVFIRQSGPLPATVVGIFPRWEVGS